MVWQLGLTKPGLTDRGVATGVAKFCMASGVLNSFKRKTEGTKSLPANIMKSKICQSQKLKTIYIRKNFTKILKKFHLHFGKKFEERNLTDLSYFFYRIQFYHLFYLSLHLSCSECFKRKSDLNPTRWWFLCHLFSRHFIQFRIFSCLTIAEKQFLNSSGVKIM